MKTRHFITVVATCAAMVLPAAGHAEPDLSTFQAFGEKPGLVKIMDDFMLRLLADPRTRPFFEKADQTRVKAQLVDQICAALEGPCTYGGAPMGPLHAGLGIREADFNALVEDLQKAMDAPVSYTHLDVYKRQVPIRPWPSWYAVTRSIPSM